jgi:zinc transport system substrate-binding protein
MRRPTRSWIPGLLALLLTGCGGGDANGGGGDAGDGNPTATKLAVYTSCFPVSFLTERVAGDRADVTLILPAGEDPPEWSPPIDTVAAMQKADLIVINGAGFEGWLGTTTLPESKLIDTTAGLKERFIELEETTHSHGRDGDHSHRGVDPHTWVDPELAVAQADKIHAALAQADPAHADAYRQNFEALRDELTRLDQELKVAVDGYDAEVLATSHPAFNYLARRYGLQLRNFGFEPDEIPTDGAMGEFTQQVGQHGIRRMLWEAQPSDEVRGVFEETGVEVIYLDPLEQPQGDADYDYLAQARANAERLKAMFPVQAAQPAGAGAVD